MVAWSWSSQIGLIFQARGKKQTKNFLAKYVNGNKVKGIYNSHFNIGSLNNKIGEVKNLVKQHSPNILGLSECELRKVNNFYDEDKLKIPGYKVLFPKTWTWTSTFAMATGNIQAVLETLSVLRDQTLNSSSLSGKLLPSSTILQR